MQYAAIFTAVKIDKFQMKKCAIFIIISALKHGLWILVERVALIYVFDQKYEK